MSLGLRGGAKLHGLLGLVTLYGAGKLRELVVQARAYATHHGLEAAFRSVRTRDGQQISFHPAAPDIVFSVSGGSVIMTAETSAVGPGYHAFVVGLIDYLSRHHQWVWDFRSATQHFGDDTGYYRNRDFAALRTAMAGDFSALSQSLVTAEAGGGVPWNVSLPMALNIASDHFAATSLGFRDRAFFEQPSPERFFPWWDQGLTAQTLKNMALCKMWLDILWHPPAGAGERQDVENCRILIDRALELGAEFAADEGVEDIAALLRDEPLDDTPGAGRIGYWRQTVWYLDPCGWSIALPAYYREEGGSDGQLCSLLYGDRAVYMRSYVYEAEVTQLAWPEPKTEGYSEYLRFETDRYRVVIESGGGVDEDGISWSVWQGTYNAHGGAARISVVSPDKADAAWAEKVLRSVQTFVSTDVSESPTLPSHRRTRPEG